MASEAPAGARQVPRVAFKTLGCKVNQVEAETIAASLVGSGAAIVPPEQADVVVVTTCTVTGEADHKARKAVRHAHALPNAPVVVVTGCLASLDDGTLAGLGDRVVVEADKAAVAARVRELLELRDTPGEAPVRMGEGFHTRAMVKVEDGCDNFCAYCIVPHARGVPRSVPVEAVVAEVEALVARGAREVVLTGINIGRHEAGLPALVAAVAATGIDRIRLSSVEPEHVDEALLATIANTPAFCEHLHIPLQSGCDATLAAMGRRYDSATYEAIVSRAREVVPGLAVTTDVIVGFPGETEDDFWASMSLIERVGFKKVHVFRYSAREGTPAAARDDRVPPAVIAERAAIVREYSDLRRRIYLHLATGTEVEVLVERPGEGVARDGTRVRFPAEAGAPGEVIRVTPAVFDGPRFALVAW